MQKFSDLLMKLDEVESGEDNEEVDKLVFEVSGGFEEAMDDDLNISKALGYIFDFMNAVNRIISEGKLSEKNAQQFKDALLSFDAVLGVMEREKQNLAEEIEEKIAQREEARKKKDFKTADKIRDELKSQGIVLEDTPKGVRWKK